MSNILQKEDAPATWFSYSLARRSLKEPGDCAERGDILSKVVTNKLETCQVRSGTDRPCDRPAAVRLQGIPFCEPCAHEQQAYFAIGGLTESVEEAGGEDTAMVADLMKKIRLRRQRIQAPEPGAA